MKALSTLRSAVNQSSFFGIIALIMLTPVTFPHLALAAELQTTEQTKAQVFEIKISSSDSEISTQNTNNNSFLSIETVANNDPLVIKLKDYLESKGSPMAEEAAELVKYDQWQRSLAISFVESNFCKTAMDKNCSSIGVAPSHRLWRKYQTYSEWMADMSELMNKPLYKEKLTTFAKMKGVYVQPGSSKWVNGAQKAYNELTALTEDANAERQTLAQQHTQAVVALATFSSITE